LVVTLLGIALTAWLLPAFTRQWDDRQKAHDLKATLASDIATATARAVIRSRIQARRSLSQKPAPFVQEVATEERLVDAWLSDSIKIEAKLRAYFDSKELVSRLHAYDATMATLFFLASAPLSPGEREPRHLKHDAKTLGMRWEALRDDLDIIRSGSESNCCAASAQSGFGEIIDAVLSQENKLIASIGGAHASGYSTNWRDLVHDLIP
jgi:hypothetical protein